jgi:hypothetical protein
MQYGIVNKRWFKIGRNRREDKYSSVQAVKYSTTYNRKGFLFILRRVGLEGMASADLTSGNLQLQKSFRELPRGKSQKISNHFHFQKFSKGCDLISFVFHEIIKEDSRITFTAVV